MQINRGVQLGLLQQQLGIDANARISVQLTQAGAVYIWDFGTGTQFIFDGNLQNVTVTKNHFEVPKRMQEIFNASDTELKKRWDEGWLDGWTDERETIFTELVMRGVNMLPGSR